MKSSAQSVLVLVAIVLGFNACATTFYVDAGNAAPAAPFTNWPTAATDIQSAIDAATDGDLILVTNGVYGTGGRVVYGALTNRVVINKAVTMQSVNGQQLTMISGGTQMRCVYAASNSGLSGFTLTNGNTLTTGDLVNEESGGGVWCESSSVVISNCVLVGNNAKHGGGAFRGTLTFCILSNNYASIYASDGVGGGGMFLGVANNCLFSANRAAYGGGAASNILNNCILEHNAALTGGGGVAGSTLNNCLLFANTCAAAGGGAFQSTLNNCTIVTNYANGGCGVYQCTLNNCISYYNYGGASPNYAGSTLNYCCTTPLPSGIANFTNEPLFVNLTNDFHLQSNSPCVNAGNNSYISKTNDFDGNPRIVGGTVDVGAYEFQTPASLLSYAWIAWAQQYGLPTNGSAYEVDSDGDGMNNWQEWIAGTNPTNAASFLQMLSATNSVSGTTKVTWQSVSGRTYYLQRSTNLAMQPAFSSIQSNIVGQANTTSFWVATPTNGNSFFYRVGVQ